MFDAHTEQRQKMLREWAEYVDSVEERTERAKEQLGERYLLHPANHVQRRAKPYGSYK
jgi:ppGpp synthetase/RelA/SpoT-type nucleotidyltranferase